MKIGYAKVLGCWQQLQSLNKIGCEKIFQEKASGAKNERKEFQITIEFVREGDIAVATHLDRLSRSP